MIDAIAKSHCEIGLTRKQRRAVYAKAILNKKANSAVIAEKTAAKNYKAISDKISKTYTGEGMRTGKVAELILAGDILNEYTKPILPLERALLRLKASE